MFSTKAWALASGLFTPKHVVQAERELLAVLRFDLHVSWTAVASHYAAIMQRNNQPTITNGVVYALRLPSSHQVLPIASSSRRPTYAYSAVQAAQPYRRPSPSFTVSSGSSSPLDSPELQTPPDTYPSHATSDPKWSHASASHVAPYVLANDLSSVAPQNPASMPMHEELQPYLLADGKLFGDPSAHAQPSLLAELYEDRKSTRLNSSHSGESRMPSSA